jgi:hypothetical protein
MAAIYIADHTGHTTVEWDEKLADEVNEIGARVFAEQRGLGKLMYKVEGGESTQLHSFDPEAKEIIAMPAPVGG